MLNMKIPQLFGMIRNDAIHLIVKSPTLRTDPIKMDEIKKRYIKCISFLLVVLPGFEPRLTEPKPVVLPLHHRTIAICFLFKSVAKIRSCF